MATTDYRRFQCDSCTAVEDVIISTAMMSLPPGWMRLSATTNSHGNKPLLWCALCLARMAVRLPNAFDGLAAPALEKHPNVPEEESRDQQISWYYGYDAAISGKARKFPKEGIGL